LDNAAPCCTSVSSQRWSALLSNDLCTHRHRGHSFSLPCKQLNSCILGPYSFSHLFPYYTVWNCPADRLTCVSTVHLSQHGLTHLKARFHPKQLTLICRVFVVNKSD
jgi:hypothetical protein